MPTCQSCQTTWSYKETMKAMWTLDPVKTCPHCGARQHISKKGRQRSILVTLFVPLVLLGNIFFDWSVGTAFLWLALAATLSILLTPYTMDLSSEEEPLF